PPGERAGVAACLTGLVRKELVRPHRSVFAEEEGFSFRHPLIRDAAYDALPKQVRGELHEGYADWLEQRPGEYEELVGYHLEQARSAGNRGVELAATIERASLLLLSDPAQTDRLLSEVEAAVPELEQIGDDRVLAVAWTLIGMRFGVWRGRFARGEEALGRALVHARRAGDRRQEAAILGNLCLAAAAGPTPVPDAVRRCEEIRDEARGDRLVEA